MAGGSDRQTTARKRKGKMAPATTAAVRCWWWNAAGRHETRVPKAHDIHFYSHQCSLCPCEHICDRVELLLGNRSDIARIRFGAAIDAKLLAIMRTPEPRQRLL